MLYLYLDESGDLGFDFFAKKPSSFFTITILAVKGVENNRALLKAVKKTVRSKLPRKQVELKGTKDSIRAKKYFYEQVSAIPFGIYSISLNKRRVYDDLAKQKDKVYNFVAKNVLDRIPVEDASARVEVIIDKSKSKKEIMEFNKYIISNVRCVLIRRFRLIYTTVGRMRTKDYRPLIHFHGVCFESTRGKTANGTIYSRER